jgi:hypothetical protein
VFFPESWYLTENRAGAPQYKLEGFKPIPFRRQVSLSKDAEGLLKVDYFPTYAYKY